MELFLYLEQKEWELTIVMRNSGQISTSIVLCGWQSCLASNQPHYNHRPFGQNQQIGNRKLKIHPYLFYLVSYLASGRFLYLLLVACQTSVCIKITWQFWKHERLIWPQYPGQHLQSEDSSSTVYYFYFAPRKKGWTPLSEILTVIKRELRHSSLITLNVV